MNRFRLFSLCAVPAVLAACSDSATAPAARSIEVPSARADVSASSASLGSQLHKNDAKYSNKGYVPATGRSGTAAIQVRGLERKDGSMYAEVTTGDFDIPGSSGGYLTKLLVKVSTKDKKVSTQNYNGLSTVSYTFAPVKASRGSVVFVQANVRGKDAPRTDVVIAEDTVRMGADLAVDRVDAPAQVRTGDVYTISAVISERNGDIGGRANAVLFIDGVRTDVANRVWVDAGGRVSVAFATRATTAGRKNVVVKLEQLLPFDYDATNNSGAAAVNVGSAQLLYNATAFEHSGTYHDYYTYKYADYPGTGGYSTRYDLKWDQQIRNQSTHVYSWVEEGISFPVSSVNVGLKTDNTQIETLSYTGLAATQTFGDATNGGSCGVKENGGSTIVVCTYRVGSARWSSLTYDRYSGTVTYVATQWSSYIAPWGEGWYYNVDPAVTTTTDNLLFGFNVAFGSTVSFQLALTSGSAQYTANPVIQLTPNAYTTSNAWCNNFPNDLNTGMVQTCYDQGGSWLDKEGFVWAPGL
jgi:hypothetical protein